MPLKRYLDFRTDRLCDLCEGTSLPKNYGGVEAPPWLVKQVGFI